MRENVIRPSDLRMLICRLCLTSFEGGFEKTPGAANHRNHRPAAMHSQQTGKLALLSASIGLGVASCSLVGGPELKGQASLMGKPLQQATVSLWESRGGEQPRRLQTVRTDDKGGFRVSLKQEPGRIHYLIARGGLVNGVEADRLSMLTVLDEQSSARRHYPSRASGVGPRLSLLQPKRSNYTMWSCCYLCLNNR